MNVLVADADEETRLTLVEAIAAVDPDSSVVEAWDGRGLQAALVGAAPDVVFIDTILPGADADAIMAWRGGDGARSVVVLVTDLLAPRWPRIAKRIDAYDVILKPLGLRGVERIMQATALIRRALPLLLVEPSGRTRDLARQVLGQSQFAFAIVEAEDGAAAIRAARAQPFDVALVGFGLPDVPALEVACRIDALQPQARILMTGREAEAMTPAQLALFGARGFLGMPYSAADIDRLVYEAFGLWQPYLVKALREEESRLAAAIRAAAVPA